MVIQHPEKRILTFGFTKPVPCTCQFHDFDVTKIWPTKVDTKYDFKYDTVLNNTESPDCLRKTRFSLAAACGDF